MTSLLGVVVLTVGIVLNAAGVFMMAHWRAGRAAALSARSKWAANGAAPENEPAPPPAVTSPPAIIGLSLVILSSVLVFLFAYHLGSL